MTDTLHRITPHLDHFKQRWEIERCTLKSNGFTNLLGNMVLKLKSGSDGVSFRMLNWQFFLFLFSKTREVDCLGIAVCPSCGCLKFTSHPQSFVLLNTVKWRVYRETETLVVLYLCLFFSMSEYSWLHIVILHDFLLCIVTPILCISYRLAANYTHYFLTLFMIQYIISQWETNKNKQTVRNK